MKGIRKTAVLAAGLAALLPGTAEAQDAQALKERCFEQLRTAGEQPATERTIALCEAALAISPKDTEIMVSLGAAYLRTGQDARSVGLFQAATDLGDPMAKTALGFVYLRGRGVPRDYDRARSLLLDTAMSGDPNAQNMLGVMNELGWGGPIDWQEAARWYRLAADQGDAAAAKHLRRLESRF